MSPENSQKLNNLLIAVANGYSECLDGIYEIAGGQMLAVAISITRERHSAEDVVHDSLIKIARFANKYKPDTEPAAWIMSIVRRTALDYLRTQKRRGEVGGEELFYLSDSGYSADKHDNAIALEQALKQLSAEDRQIIYYVYYLDMTLREIAKQTHSSKSAVQRAIKKAEKNLKIALFGGTNDDPETL